MTDPIPVFVNERAVTVAAGTDVLGAVREADPSLAGRLQGGEAYVTDGRGIRLATEAVVFAGAILRVVVSARDASRLGDAHA